MFTSWVRIYTKSEEIPCSDQCQQDAVLRTLELGKGKNNSSIAIPASMWGVYIIN